MDLTLEQRRVLIDALIEDWLSYIRNTFSDGEDFVADMLFNGRVGYSDYSNEELINACYGAELFIALEAAGVKNRRGRIMSDALLKALHEISLCSKNSMCSKDECGRIARKAIEQFNQPTYSHARIAWELERTAMGDGFYGNALRVAKDIAGLTSENRSLLDRFLTGLNRGTDHIELQDLALRIYLDE